MPASRSTRQCRKPGGPSSAPAIFNPDQNGQRYFIDPDVGGTIEAVWYEPVDNLAALGEFRRIAASPSPNNDRVFILELLAEPNAEPARLTITLHFACRPARASVPPL